MKFDEHRIFVARSVEFGSCWVLGSPVACAPSAPRMTAIEKRAEFHPHQASPFKPVQIRKHRNPFTKYPPSNDCAPTYAPWLEDLRTGGDFGGVA